MYIIHFLCMSQSKFIVVWSKSRLHFLFFLISVSSRVFTKMLQCQMATEQPMVSSLGASPALSCKRFSFSHCSYLVTVNFLRPGQYPTSLWGCPFWKIFEPPLHCTSITRSWAKCAVCVPQVVFSALQPTFTSNKNCLHLLLVQHRF